jgi:hypothetical protein
MSAAASLLGSIDLMGWAAAGVTMMTFACQDMRRLRVLALLANAAFIAYGAMAMLLPVLVLHLILAPINLLRLWSLRRAQSAAPAPRPYGTSTTRPRTRPARRSLRASSACASGRSVSGSGGSAPACASANSSRNSSRLPT